MEKTIFDTLYSINVNKHVEKKNGLSYLSWGYAWAEVKKKYPQATYKVYENKDGYFYHTDGKTCWVKTGVTIEKLEYIEYLPIMDYRNKSIPVEKITSFDVNKAIQRSLTKALARHGLGLYIYAGEDLPESEIEKITARDASILKGIIDNLKDSDKLMQRILKSYKIKDLKSLNQKQYCDILQSVKDLPKKEAKQNDPI